MLLLLNITQFKMGVRNSRESEINLMKQYTIIQRNPNDNLTFLQHNKTNEEYLLKQFTFNDKKQCEKTMQKLVSLKAKLSGNKHVVPLTHFFMSSEDQYCSTFYKIYAVYEYPQRTLLTEITERKLLKKRFTETELWSILASCIVGLSHLQRNGIKHSALKSSTILLSQQGVIKIADPFAVGLISNEDAVLTKKSSLHAYFSPQQTKAVQQEGSAPAYNTYKSDIFSLGMIMLEAGLLEFQDDECYRDEKARIHWEAVQYNINRLGQAYSDEIRNMVEFMLSQDEKVRPDWIDLEEHVMKSGEEGRKSMISDENQREDGLLMKPMKVEGHLHTENKVAVINAPGRSSGPTTFTPNNQVPPHFLPQIPPTVHGPMNPQVRTMTQPNQQIVGNGSGVQTNKCNGWEYNRVLKANPTVTMSSHTAPLAPTQNHYSFGNDPLMSGNYFPNAMGMHSLSIAPLRPSLIGGCRPTLNIFPSDTYVLKTQYDQNLILLVEDEEEGETEEETKGENLPTVPIANVHQQPFTQTSNLITKQFEYQLTPIAHSLQSDPLKNFAISSQPDARSIATSPQQLVSQPTLLPCSNSNLQFVKEEFKMGSRYEGYKLNGLRHGYGRFYYQDGGMYDGSWRENRMEGQGKLYYQSGKLAYDGTWKGDQFMGYGVLYNEAHDSLSGSFNYNNFDDVDEHWTKYEGYFLDDKKNGKGTLFLTNGERFQGNFVDDCAEGTGVFHCRNGTKVRGVWKSNLLVK